MKRVILKQPPFFVAKVMLGAPLLLASFALIDGDIYFLPVFIILILFMFTSSAYEFNENLNHSLNINIFYMTVLRIKKVFIQPEFISLFNQPFKSSNSFGFMELGQTKYKEYTLKLFNKKKHEIVFRTSNKEEALRLGKDLASMFKVELHNTLE